MLKKLIPVVVFVVLWYALLPFIVELTGLNIGPIEFGLYLLLGLIIAVGIFFWGRRAK